MISAILNYKQILIEENKIKIIFMILLFSSWKYATYSYKELASKPQQNQSIVSKSLNLSSQQISLAIGTYNV